MKPIHDVTARRFRITEGDDDAFLIYEASPDGGVIVTHTYVPPAWRGRGVAEKLVRALLADAERRGWQVGSRCSYVTAFLDRHPEFAALRAHNAVTSQS